MKILSLLLLVASFVISTFAKAATPPFTIAISPENSEVMAGSPLRVKTLLTNTSNQPMNVSHELGELDPAYHYEVRDSGGRLLGQKKVERPAQGSVIVIMLKPGESSAGLTDLSAAFDLTRPGVYSVQMKRTVSEDPNAEVIESNIITVTVTQARPFVLRIAGYSDGKFGPDDRLAAKAGANIGINIEKKNVSKLETDCSSSMNNLTGLDDKYEYDIRNEAGKPMGKRAIEVGASAYTKGLDRTIPCKPGESAGESVTLTRLYDLGRPGKYTIQVSQPVSGNPRDGVVKSNIVTLTVTP